ncbi:MAG: inositol monophosphatase [Dehalococcoidia bacterium]|nr:inositol monophosphatase [Dehalococcoidia bacterium]
MTSGMADSSVQLSLDIDPALLIDIEKHAVSLATEAGTLLLDYFQRKLQVEFKSKGQRDPVTEADKKAEEVIIAGIQRRFPQHGILSEETPETQAPDSDFLWVVDPLDGTTNFINRYPFFGVSLGVLYKGIPVVGAMFTSASLATDGQLLHARRGGGAFAGDVPIRVYDEKEPSARALLAMPAFAWRQFHWRRDLRRTQGNVRITGSIVCELALVASGVLQYAAFVGPRIWDVAAGIIIVREAGGEVLVHGRNRRWGPLRSFLEPATGLPPDGDLRKWRGWLLTGNSTVVTQTGTGLRPRRRPWRWLRQRLTRQTG